MDAGRAILDPLPCLTLLGPVVAAVRWASDDENRDCAKQRSGAS